MVRAGSIFGSGRSDAADFDPGSHWSGRMVPLAIQFASFKLYEQDEAETVGSRFGVKIWLE
jgi:hypothetical protein